MDKKEERDNKYMRILEKHLRKEIPFLFISEENVCFEGVNLEKYHSKMLKLVGLVAFTLTRIGFEKERILEVVEFGVNIAPKVGKEEDENV